MARVSRIVNSVVMELGRFGLPQLQEDVVLYNLEKTQEDIARRGNAIEGDGVLDTVVDVGEYAIDAGIHRLLALIEPVEWTQDISIVMSVRDWKRIKRDTTLTSGASQPLYGFVWNNQIRLHPAPTEIVTVEWIAYIAPQLTMVLENPQQGQTDNPEVDQHWDDALQLGTIWRMLRIEAMNDPKLQGPIEYYRNLYEEELTKQDQLEISRYLGEPHVRQSSSEEMIGGGDILGF